MTESEQFRILVVEDSKTQADIIIHYLLQEGYSTVWADSPHTAFDILSHTPIDLILTDILMPGMDGYEFCHRIKNDPKLSLIPVIFVTQLSDPGDIIKGLCCGANNFIIKPVRKEPLIREVALVVEQKSDHGSYQLERQKKIPFWYDGHEYAIRSSREDLVRILMSIYQTAAQKNKELEETTRELNEFTSRLEELVEERTQALSVTNEIVEHLLMQRTELITHIGHDLKTPLTPLYAFLPYLYQNETNEEKKEILSLLVKNVTVLKQLVERILKLSHITMDTFSDEKGSADIYLISREVLGNYSYLLEQKTITVENKILPGTKIPMSHFHAMTVMENLVSNAILYNTDKGLITLTCEDEDAGVMLSIEDTGIGLTPDQIRRVFDDFYKADQSRHDHRTHGLGLAIVRRIVSLYGGTISVKSPGLGCGSTFTVLLKERENKVPSNSHHGGLL